MSRARPLLGVVPFVVACAASLIVALLQGLKPFYYDSGRYWELGQTFTVNGHFSLLNFDSPERGYVLPLIDHGLQLISEALVWNPSSLAKLFNVIVFALIGAVFAPMLAEVVWPQRRWGAVRRLMLVVILIVFWGGFLSYPLSDFPALAMTLLALLAVAHPDTPGWMLLAGVAGGLALDMRASYLTVVPLLVALVVWAWFTRRDSKRAPVTRRVLCAALLVLGFAVVSLPQSLASHRHGFTWSFVPGATLSLPNLYLNPGFPTQLYETYVGPGESGPKMLYGDRTGEAILAEQTGHQITSTAQYVGLIIGHPIAMTSLLARHVINALDTRYSTPYVEHLEAGSRWAVRFVGFLLVFLALARILWPAARRRLAPTNWRYLIALALCCVTTLPTPIEARYLLPVYMFCYMVVLAPGWPSPVGPAGTGLRRFRTLAILGGALAVYMAIVWHVTSVADSQLHFV